MKCFHFLKVWIFFSAWQRQTTFSKEKYYVLGPCCAPTRLGRYILTHLHTYIPTYLYILTNPSTYIQTCMHACHTHTHIHTRIHTYIQTDRQTYKHTDIQTYRSHFGSSICDLPATCFGTLVKVNSVNSQHLKSGKNWTDIWVRELHKNHKDSLPEE